MLVNRGLKIPAFRSRSHYLFASLVWAILAAQIYLFTNQQSAPTLPLLDIDRRIPYLPSSIFAYVGIYALMFWASLRITDLKFATRYLCFWVILQLSAMCIYLAYPVSYPRALFIHDANVASSWHSLIAVWHRLDGPANCLPSLHVSTALMALSAFMRGAGAMPTKVATCIAILMAMATILSTLTFKQHYVVDLFAGAIQAGIVYWFVFKSGFLKVH
jgi:membrane-associated phospholipid phosphatase